MGIIDWLANIDPGLRVVVGALLSGVGLVLGVMWLSYTRGWSAQQPAPKRPHSHARRWYGVRNGQESAARIVARLRQERARPTARDVWAADDPTWPIPVVPS